MDRVERQRARLDILIEEAGGTHARLAERVGTAESYISQLKTARNGIARKFCVRLEKAMNKPDGWMDQWLPDEIEGKTLKGGPITPNERRLLGMYRRLSSTLKRAAFSKIVEFRVTPDLSEQMYRPTTEDELDTWVTTHVSEDGEYYEPGLNSKK